MPATRARTRISGSYASSTSVLRDQRTNASGHPLPGVTTRHMASLISISSDLELNPGYNGPSSEIEALDGPSKLHTHASDGHVDWKQNFKEAETQLGEQSRKRAAELKKSDVEILTLKEKLTNMQDEIKAITDARSLREGEETRKESLSNVTETLLESVRESLSCKICFELVEKLYALSACGHAFCGNCLRDWIGRYQAVANADNDGAGAQRVGIAYADPKPVAQGCPTCRIPIKTRPVRVYLLGEIVDLIKSPAEREVVKVDGKVESDANLWQAFFDKDDVRG